MQAGERLALRYRPPLAWDDLVRFLAERAVPGVEEVVDGVYRRTTRLDGSLRVVELEHAPREVVVRLRGTGGESLGQLAERARLLLDLDADPLAIDSALARSPTLRGLVEQRPGLRVPGAWDGFELAVRAVLGQQVSVRGARTLAGRLAARFGEELDAPDGALTHLFPEPDVLAEADCRAIGIPRARARTLTLLAEAVACGAVVLAPSADPAQTRAQLLELPGIGPWTAEYVAMRALRDPDAFPVGDLGLRRAGVTPGRAQVWRPWRAYATMHVWLAGP